MKTVSRPQATSCPVTVATTECQPGTCPCGYERRGTPHRLIDLVRDLLASGGDLARRRAAHQALRQHVTAHDKRVAERVALHKFFRCLPRHKDVDLCRAILGEYGAVAQGTLAEIAVQTRTPLEHVEHLHHRLACVLAGRPLPIPRHWIRMAVARRERAEARYAARLASRRAA